MRNVITLVCFIVFLVSCTLLPDKKQKTEAPNPDDTLATINNAYADTSDPLYINTGNTKPEDLINYAQTFIGVPYVYASTKPDVGFDCSGFITYVFNHFNIEVPRASVNFTNVLHEVPVSEAKPADLILFTGTDSTIRTVGHMGIVVWSNANELVFIHSSSGKANGVTLTPLNDYYKGRFVKIIRVFPQNG